MKKIFILFFVLVFGHGTYAQSLEYIDLPVSGEQWTEYRDTLATGFVITPSAAGQIWDYSSSFTVHKTINYAFQNPAGAPNSIDTIYPQANLYYPDGNADEHHFLRIDIDGMYESGIYSNTGYNVYNHIVHAKKFQPEKLLLPVPFQFANVVQNTSNFEYVFPDTTLLPTALIRVTYSTFQDFEAESQGQLTTPYGYYNNVLRLRVMRTENTLLEIDSFASGNFTYFTEINYPTKNSYLWVKSGPNCVVMSAQLDENNQMVSASYYAAQSVVNTKNNTLQSSLNVFPNPASETVHISNNNNTITRVRVFDILGRVVYAPNVVEKSAEILIDTKEWETGTYFLQAIDKNNQTLRTKLVINK